MMGNWDMYLRQLALENLSHMIKQVRSWCDELEKQDNDDEKEEEKLEVEDTKFDVEKQIQLKGEIQKSIRKFNYKPD